MPPNPKATPVMIAAQCRLLRLTDQLLRDADRLRDARDELLSALRTSPPRAEPSREEAPHAD